MTDRAALAAEAKRLVSEMAAAAARGGVGPFTATQLYAAIDVLAAEPAKVEPMTRVAPGVVQVCHLRDSECGDSPRSWCTECPKRAKAEPAQPVEGWQLVPVDRDGLRRALMDKFNSLIPSRYFHTWNGWPGSWAFAEAALSMLYAAPTAPQAQPVEHVCGLQGFGALGDECPACRQLSAPARPEALPPLPEQLDKANARIEHLRSCLRAVIDEMDEGDGHAPGHCHDVPRVWDSGNGELAGKPCAWCITWEMVKRAALAQQESNHG